MDAAIWQLFMRCYACASVFTFLAALSVERCVAETLPAPVPAGGGAYANCPCKSYPPATPTSDGMLLSRIASDYGSSTCKAWDAQAARLPECKRSSRPKWCEAKWCYVDRARCNRTHFRSIFAWNESRFYSYATCGYVDSFSVQVPWEYQRTSPKIQIGVIYPEATISKEPNLPSPYSRIFYEFAYDVMQDMQLDLRDIIYQNLSSASRQAFPNSVYSSCVNDIALGNIDVCVGGIWSTAQRLALRDVAFVPVSSTSWILIYPRKHWTKTLGAHLAAPFEPFSLGLWGMLFATLILAGSAIAFFENGLLDDLDFKSRPFRSLLHMIFYMPINFFQGSLTNVPRSLSGRIVAAGVTSFLLIVLANFTANITVFILSDSFSQDLHSIDEAVLRNMKVCYVASMQEQLFVKYPKLANPSYGIAIAGAANNIQPSLAAGKCDVAVIDEHHFKMEHANGRLCGFNVAPMPVDYIFVGYYVAYWISKTTSYHVAQRRADGTWYSLESRLLQAASKCAGSSAFQDGAVQLVAEDMYGICLVVVFSVVAAGVVWLWKAIRKSWNLEQKVRNESEFDSEMGDVVKKDEFDIEARETLKQVHAMLLAMTGTPCSSEASHATHVSLEFPSELGGAHPDSNVAPAREQPLYEPSLQRVNDGFAGQQNLSHLFQPKDEEHTASTRHKDYLGFGKPALWPLQI